MDVILLNETDVKEIMVIPGRGLVFQVFDPKHRFTEVGTRFEFRGELYEVRGVERFLKLIDPPIPGDNVGLQVRKLEKSA